MCASVTAFYLGASHEKAPPEKINTPLRRVGPPRGGAQAQGARAPAPPAPRPPAASVAAAPAATAPAPPPCHGRRVSNCSQHDRQPTQERTAANVAGTRIRLGTIDRSFFRMRFSNLIFEGFFFGKFWVFEFFLCAYEKMVFRCFVHCVI